MAPFVFSRKYTVLSWEEYINGRIPVIWCKRAYQDGKRALSRGKS